MKHTLALILAILSGSALGATASYYITMSRMQSILMNAEIHVPSLKQNKVVVRWLMAENKPNCATLDLSRIGEARAMSQLVGFETTPSGQYGFVSLWAYANAHKDLHHELTNAERKVCVPEYPVQVYRVAKNNTYLTRPTYSIKAWKETATMKQNSEIRADVGKDCIGERIKASTNYAWYMQVTPQGATDAMTLCKPEDTAVLWKDYVL
jgi:hypothetical protein